MSGRLAAGRGDRAEAFQERHRTLRRRLLQIAGRLTRHGRSWTLHLPARWPWHSDYLAALARIRALPAA